MKDQLQMELNRNIVLQSQMDKLKIYLEKKLADKEDEYDMHRFFFLTLKIFFSYPKLLIKKKCTSSPTRSATSSIRRK